MTRRERDRLRRLLAALEVPDCTCPLDYACPCDESCEPGADCPCCRGGCGHPPKRNQPPCRHVLGKTHELTIGEWAELLTAAWPKLYADRPAPPTPHRCLRRNARVAALARRAREGVALWHPADLKRNDPRTPRIGFVGEPARGNFADGPLKVLTHAE